MNKISISSIKADKNRIDIKFHTEGAISKFISSNAFWCEYSEDVDDIPKSIAVIPFVCNILPILWLTNATLELDELDEDFYSHISLIKKGYADMYPMLEFNGALNPKRLIRNILPPPIGSGLYQSPNLSRKDSAAFFSGGVDAFATLIAHADEKPLLITLWGSDITHDDIRGWNIVRNHAIETAAQFNTDVTFVKSNFRMFLNDRELNKLVAAGKDNYWHGFQHGIGLIGHAAPIVFNHGLGTIYIASSYTAANKSTCASDPTIDNHVNIAGCKTIHDQYEFERQDKVRHICDFLRDKSDKPVLRVCWITSGGRNCCKCEKCLRTMFEIFAEGEDPRQYGFEYTIDDLKKSKYRVLSGFNKSNAPAWHEVVKRFKQNDKALLPDEIRWILEVDFERESSALAFRINRFITTLPKRIIRKIKRLLVK